MLQGLDASILSSVAAVNRVSFLYLRSSLLFVSLERTHPRPPKENANEQLCGREPSY